MQACIRAIEYFLPEQQLTNAELAREMGDWSAEKIELKTGIAGRHVARMGECSSDLAVGAAQKLFLSGVCRPDDIDFILLCTQSPDYFLPTTACLLQDKLGIPTSAGALDFNLGCSGYVYGLGLAKGLIETGLARNLLLITAETYSKFIHPKDRSVRTIFGDAAAATLVSLSDGVDNKATPCLGPFVFGTDGRGAQNLIVPTGGMRASIVANAEPKSDESGNVRTINNLFMNGMEIFDFTMKAVPAAVSQLLTSADLTIQDVDLFVFHQANKFMLDHLRKTMKLPPEKFIISCRETGNTVSSTIPIALRDASAQGVLKRGQRVMLVGFGVGYSWGATFIRW